MKKNGLLDNLYKNAGYYSVALISLVYIASSLVLISKTGRSVYEIIGTGFLSLVVGSLINGSLRNVGIRRGEEDERTVATVMLHSEAVEEIAPYIDRLDEYCESENKRTIKIIRAKILAEAGLKYDDCFDENGVAKEIAIDYKSCRGGACSSRQREAKKKIRQRKRAYKKAVNLKFKSLVASNLTSDGGDFNNPFDFGKSKREYTKSRSASDMLVRAVMAIIFGYFGVTLVSEVNFATIIWNSLQIVMYIASGIIGMYSTYMWIVDDYRQGVIKKIDHLQKFKIFAERTM